MASKGDKKQQLTGLLDVYYRYELLDIKTATQRDRDAIVPLHQLDSGVLNVLLYTCTVYILLSSVHYVIRKNNRVTFGRHSVIIVGSGN